MPAPPWVRRDGSTDVAIPYFCNLANTPQLEESAGMDGIGLRLKVHRWIACCLGSYTSNDPKPLCRRRWTWPNDIQYISRNLGVPWNKIGNELTQSP